MAEALADKSWFQEAHYGMFVHWGPYAVAGRGEWVMNRERIPAAEYREKYVQNFRAENYDPAAWVRLAVEAGMKYVVLTTRHHDGFCLWDTKTSENNAMNFGPRRDLLRPFADAVRAAGLKLGFYYSGADWTHPDYPDAFARDWAKGWQSPEHRARFIAYYKAQLRELMTQYGKVDLLWYDGCSPADMREPAANLMVRELQPHIMINNRNGEPCDFQCSEQTIKPAAEGTPWEACMTLNDNWGYHASDRNWKRAGDVLGMLLETRKSGGNLLLNVGPKADGTIPAETVAILREAGAWIRRHEEIFPGVDRSPFTWNNSSKLTVRGNTIYVNFEKVGPREMCVADIRNRVLSARHVGSGRAIPFEQRMNEGRLFLRELPGREEEPLVATIALAVEGKPQSIATQENFWIPT